MPCPICIPLCLSRLHGDRGLWGFSTALSLRTVYALNCSTFCLVCIGLSGRVLGRSQYDSPGPVLGSGSNSISVVVAVPLPQRHCGRASCPGLSTFGLIKIRSASRPSRQRSTGRNTRLLVDCHQKDILHCTLRAPLSGTFLQTLPDLVTPLKGYSLSPRICPTTRSAPSERFGY